MAPQPSDENPPTPTVRLLCILGLTLLGAGCQSSDDVATSEVEATTTAATEDEGTGSTGEASDGDATTTTGAVDDDAPFDLERENIRLYPYAIRLGRLALLLDRPPEDPIFAEMQARRYELGDYDFSQNINPDLTWSTTRMGHWIAALRPVCSSAVMKERYPEFPQDLPELMHDAYGYPPSSAELEPYLGLFADAEDPAENDDGVDKGTTPVDPMSAAVRYETACIAVLSSLEFVAQ